MDKSFLVQALIPALLTVWPWVDKILLSANSMFWGCAMTLHTTDGEVMQITLPAFDCDPPWSRWFRGVRKAVFNVGDTRFTLSASLVEPAKDAFQGMDFLARSGQGWVFHLPYTPQDAPWPAGTSMKMSASFLASHGQETNKQHTEASHDDHTR